MSNLGQGVLITLAGMGLVFLVLALLWLLMALLVRTDRRHAPVPTQLTQPAAQPAPVAAERAAVWPAAQTAPLPGADGAGAITGAMIVRSNATGHPASAGRSDCAELSPEMLAAVMGAVRMHRRVLRKQAAPAMRTHQPGTLPSRWVGVGRVSQNQSWHPRRR